MRRGTPPAVYCYTIVMAIHEVAVALNCSNVEAVIADALSKADFKRFYELMPNRKLNPARIPVALLEWINDPREDTKLGKKILQEMAKSTMVLGYNC